jgi:hypothetical protein
MPLIAGILTTLLLGVIFTLLVRKAARAKGMVAAPRQDRWHSKPTAMMGGVAIYRAFMLGYFLFVYLPGAEIDKAYLVLAAGTLMFITGLIDDIINIKPYTKLVAQLIAAAFINSFEKLISKKRFVLSTLILPLILFAHVFSPLAPAEEKWRPAGTVIAATDAYINGNPALTGTTVPSGASVTTEPKGYAVIYLETGGRLELRYGASAAVELLADAAQIRVACSRSRIEITRGEVTVKTPAAKSLKAGESAAFDQMIDAAVTAETEMIVDCGAPSPADAALLADARAAQREVGLFALICYVALIAVDMASGGRRFLQRPPEAADPITP